MNTQPTPNLKAKEAGKVSEMFPLQAVITTERQLLAIALALGAREVPGWSPVETEAVRKLPCVSNVIVQWVREQIQKGEDPLGQLFCELRPPEIRREKGATYTPQRIVDAMLDWAEDNGKPSRIIDPGVGSGRYLISAAKRFPTATGLGIEIDPTAAIIARANIAANRLQGRLKISLGDFRNGITPNGSGTTLFVGNPPYVRHHLIDTKWKNWLTRKAISLGLSSSQLAGLHVYFLLATALSGKTGDYGCFITAAEWLDVNYGKLVRELFLETLGGQKLIVIEPTALPFPDAATTAAITCFKILTKPKKIGIQRVKTISQLGRLDGGTSVIRERLVTEARWSHLTRRSGKPPAGYVEVGELFRVHRGQVTGANRVWIAGDHSDGLPQSCLFPTVTRAKELFSAGSVLEDSSALKQIIDLPTDLDSLPDDEREAVERFLKKAKQLGADKSYVAQNRRAWWAVGLRTPAPILATYMARRPPAFVVNKAEARHINIAHGLYPREKLSTKVLDSVAKHLSTMTSLTSGRTYSGGLTKFEPREMERLVIPGPELLSHNG